MKFDLVVIGSGPAGQRAALQAAKAGKKAVIIEKGDCLGGACVYSGTLPSKSFRESVYRWSLSSEGILFSDIDKKRRDKIKLPEMKHLLRRRDRVVEDEGQVVTDQLTRNGVKILTGAAKFESAHQITVTKQDGSQEWVEGDYFIIATGAHPVAPENLRVDHEFVFDNNTVLEMKKFPRHLTVLGGGVIGTEYASMFLMAGTKVTIVDKHERALASVDFEVGDSLFDRLKHFGIEMVLGTVCEKLEIKKGSDYPCTLTLSDGKTLKSDAVLVAMGRRGNIDPLGLEKAGLRANQRGLIEVDKHFRTQVENIYAVGDVIGIPALAATSFEQGRIAACNAFRIEGETSQKMQEFYPYGIYTIPELSMIGPTEEQLKKDGVAYAVGRGRYKELARGQIVGDRWGLLKLLARREDLKLLGVHIVGDNAADLIHIGQAVLNYGGDVRYFIKSVFNYPTLAEAYKTAAFDLVNHGLN